MPLERGCTKPGELVVVGKRRAITWLNSSNSDVSLLPVALGRHRDLVVSKQPKLWLSTLQRVPADGGGRHGTTSVLQSVELPYEHRVLRKILYPW
ncbi:unnamed protein product [Chondrus crispus]|uniref:Uncharacterized protein n=1 Tax=Chondrus crispus TaxID=2769 RepID=R7Q564_CHOCR|nr:unnamed protein product [Chondrus crispus]CDF32486.1 unnamed protein product [Chondrus crispus]|eukprot:XP_005712151.1 unnamed protein product [Chondrus crispus]